MKNRILTARIDEQVSEEIAFLKQELNLKNTSHVILQAIHQMYEVVKKRKSEKKPFEIMEELGLIGCIKADKNLSKHYKREISKGLLKKHGISPPKR